MDNNTDTLTPIEAAEILGISAERVYAMLRGGQIPGAERVKVASEWRIPRESLDIESVRIRPRGRPRKVK